MKNTAGKSTTCRCTCPRSCSYGLHTSTCICKGRRTCICPCSLHTQICFCKGRCSSTCSSTCRLVDFPLAHLPLHLQVLLRLHLLLETATSCFLLSLHTSSEIHLLSGEFRSQSFFESIKFQLDTFDILFLQGAAWADKSIGMDGSFDKVNVNVWMDTEYHLFWHFCITIHY